MFKDKLVPCVFSSFPALVVFHFFFGTSCNFYIIMLWIALYSRCFLDCFSFPPLILRGHTGGI